MEIQPTFKDQIQKEIQKQQETQLLGKYKYRPGLQLFGLDPATGEVYQVKIQQKKSTTYHLQGARSTKWASVNPRHFHLWALNMKSAVRKFQKFVNRFESKKGE